MNYCRFLSLILVMLLLCAFVLKAGEPAAADTLKTHRIEDVKVTGYLRPVEQFITPASTAVLTERNIQLETPASLVTAMNTVPGIRMEERSPGSYRLSIRGSLIRSPYGVRNVKVYYNGFALTDGGGNTYMSALNAADIAGVEILKGPDGSLFGANSGGVVLLSSDAFDPNEISVRAFGGSYGYIGNALHVGQRSGRHTWSVRQSYQRADGYRQNTRNHRLFVQASDDWNYSKDNHLEIYAFYSDFAYRTPGGLTLEQYEENPRQSRPATSRLPGSADQKTGSEANMYFAGLRNKIRISAHVEHTISIWGNYVDYSNSAISNYETRDETNLGLRTYFSFSRPTGVVADFLPSLQVGFEGQRLNTEIANYDNLAGTPGDKQASNRIVSHQLFPFVRGDFNWRERLSVHAAVSVNFNGYNFKDESGVRNNFDPVWMPHLGINYRVSDPVSLRLTFSRGYSTPTTAEIRPTDNKIYDNLQPEKGWNTEAGVRLQLLQSRLHIDASAFHYLLRDGIVSRINETDDTYFVNAGRIRQLGVEYTHSWILKSWSGNDFFRMIRWNGSYTFSGFKYDRYESGGDDFTGNRVPGVPRHVVVNNIEFRLPLSLYFFAQHNYTSCIPLNDANEVYSDSYNLVWLKLGIDRTRERRWPVNIYLAIDNLLDERYSLGNDSNAFGGRYYNAAPPINFQIGVQWRIN